VFILWYWKRKDALLPTCSSLFSGQVPLMLERSGATFLNLSLLTSDVFAIVAGIFLFGFVPSLFYILAAALIVGGLIVFNVSNEEKTVTMTDLENQ
jgi:hypothetical protein